MKRPSGDKAGPNSGQGDRVSRLSPVPSALMDQTSWRLSKTIRPESQVRSMAPEPPGSADTVDEGLGAPAGGDAGGGGLLVRRVRTNVSATASRIIGVRGIGPSLLSASSTRVRARRFPD